MMNVVIGGGGSSECRSGCESGWTLYLQHSTSNYSVSSNKKKGSDKCHHYNSRSKKHQKLDDVDDDEQYQMNEFDDDDEDLSMVSDASSGPPHFDHDIDDDDDDEVFCYNINNNTGGGGVGKKRQSMKLSSPDFALDDTASSPNFISKKNGGQNSNGSSLKRMIDYSSQGFSATHLNHQRSNNFQEHYAVIQSPLSSTIQFQPNQWT